MVSGGIVYDFLRDAQHRIAEITIELDRQEDESDERSLDLLEQRLSLYRFIDILYPTLYDIKDGYNFIDWDDDEIYKEIERLRLLTRMSSAPYMELDFTANEIVELNESSGSATLPIGTNNQMLVYGTNGEATPQSISNYAGMTTETLSTYFNR